MRSVLNISCAECKTHIITFVHGGGTPLMRRRISRHLDHCLTCYELYRRELDLMHSLSREVRLIGETDQPDFENLWDGIQSKIQAPKPVVPQFPMRYGLAMLVLGLSFLTPMTLANHNVSVETPPTQPAPLVARMTPAITSPLITKTIVAYLTDFSQATPEAPQHTAGPSVQDVVNTP